jgi:hypothetical protein
VAENLINHARRQVGNKVYGGQSSHLPLKLNIWRVDSTHLCIVHYFVTGDGCGLGSVQAKAWSG